MSKKTLAVELSRLKGFENPDISLEQHPTDSEIGATAIWSADLKEWIKGKTVADLGAGTGVLGIGCLLLGAKKVIFIEKDPDAITILKQNLKKISEEYEIPSYEIIESDIENFTKKVDFVAMNPPFGTVEKGTDVEFLKKAMSISDKILTFHKTETAEFIEKKINENNFKIIERQDTSFPLKKTYEHHKKRMQRINVTSWLLENK